MENLYLLFNSRSSVTGRALSGVLSSRAIPNDLETDLTLSPVLDRDIKVLKTSRDRTGRNADIVLRWGNSTTDVQGSPRLELNTREAVARATDKGVMMRTLVDAGIPTPIVVFPGDDLSLVNTNGDFYFRDRLDHVRFGSTPTNGWKYASQPVNRAAEFRVHVFNGKILGVYEKRPQSNDARILKDDNCDFVRLNMANREHAQYCRGARPIAKRAVAALGLLFGGCDIIKDTDGNCFVLEVNSAPALNGPNLVRWANAINEFIQNPVINELNEEEGNTPNSGNRRVDNSQENQRPAHVRQDRDVQVEAEAIHREGERTEGNQQEQADMPATAQGEFPIGGRYNEEGVQRGREGNAGRDRIVRLEFPVSLMDNEQFAALVSRLIVHGKGLVLI